jgi:hypothetical protein
MARDSCTGGRAPGTGAGAFDFREGVVADNPIPRPPASAYSAGIERWTPRSGRTEMNSTRLGARRSAAQHERTIPVAAPADGAVFATIVRVGATA